ncbi:MAG: glycosyltransferase [Phycisphaerae bacterium]
MTLLQSSGAVPCAASPVREPLSDGLAGRNARGADVDAWLPVMPASSWCRAEPFLKATLVSAAAALLLWTVTTPAFWRFHFLSQRSPAALALWGLAVGYGVVMLAALIWRVRLWRRYRPTPPVAQDVLPSMSVVIPAFNEGALVRAAIRSVLKNRYPADRLELIVVDDGSTDDTWRHIRAAVRAAPDGPHITTLRLSRNRGKRRALYEGFARARGDVFVTMDSDSVLDSDALRQVVSPLVRDRTIGCVSGCVQAMNPRESLITRFLKCYFSLSFKFVRAYQSEFRGVFCAPGALSAYRADRVRAIADEWLNQRFCGLPCETGEDRAMTNLFLRDGCMTAYQGSAVVWSRVPHTYRGMANMFLRWARSNIRETIVLWRFLLTPFRDRHRLAFTLNMVLVLLSLVLPPILICHSAALLMVCDGFVIRYLGGVLLFSVITAVVYYVNERDDDWVWLLAYGFFWTACLSWILPYAALTLRNTGWLTRGESRHASNDVVGGFGSREPRTRPPHSLRVDPVWRYTT